MSDSTGENLRLIHALENVFTCRTLQQAKRFARSALREMTVCEAADRLGVSRQHLHNLICEGQLKSRRAGRFRLIHEDEIDRLVREGYQDLAQPQPGSLRTRAIMRCAEFLTFCLEIGWPRTDLEELETMWWRCHDTSTGQLLEHF